MDAAVFGAVVPVISSVVGLSPGLFARLEFECSSRCMTLNVSPVIKLRLV